MVKQHRFCKNAENVNIYLKKKLNNLHSLRLISSDINKTAVTV